MGCLLSQSHKDTQAQGTLETLGAPPGMAWLGPQCVGGEPPVISTPLHLFGVFVA